MIITEQPSPIWNLSPTFSLKIDRSGILVADYLKMCGVSWDFGENPDADCALYKEDVGHLTASRVWMEVKKRLLNPIPFISLIGEPREFAPAAYLLAQNHNTFAVAPGRDLPRLYFASEWLDPMLDDWHKRADCVCWIARPLPERVLLARQLIDCGIPVHIYSRERWPLPVWQGYADDEVTVARRYRYRIVVENSCANGYHSEKMFNSIRCGCVTFYKGDPSLNLSHATGTFLPLDLETIQRRGDIASDVLKGIGRFMFSNAWEIYSFKAFYDRIIGLAKVIISKQ